MRRLGDWPPGRIYQYQIAHCSQPVINRWLDLGAADDRCSDSALEDRLADALQHPYAGVAPEVEAALADALIHRQILHSQWPVSTALSAGTFRLLLLRDPAQRLLEAARKMELTSAMADVSGERATAELATLVAVAQQPRYRRWLDNHLVRALAASRLGPLALEVDSAEALMPVAMAALEDDFDFVGLHEDPLLLPRLAAALGRPTPGFEWLVEPSIAPIDVATVDALISLDRQLYDHARSRLIATAPVTADECTRRFDQGPAMPLQLNRLMALGSEAEAAHGQRFSVRGPLIASGLHGRDASGLPQCRVWSGANLRMTLWLPVPAGESVTVELDLHGYAHERQRQHLWVACDGSRHPHRFEPLDGYRERLAIDCLPQRSALAVTVILDETLSGLDLGETDGDERRRGISFDRYGWRRGGTAV